MKSAKLRVQVPVQGGRMTKFKGRAASIASRLGVAFVATGLSGTAVLAANECGAYAAPPAVITCNTTTYTTGPNDSIEYRGASITGLNLDIDDENLVVGASDRAVWVVSYGDSVVNAIDFDSLANTGLGSQVTAIHNNTVGAFDATTWISGAAGSISTVGYRSHGAQSRVFGSGSALTTMDGGTIVVGGELSAGIVSTGISLGAANTSVAIMNDGSITATGLDARGIWADSGGTGAVLAQMNDGTVSIQGAGAGFGIYAHAWETFNQAPVTAEMTGGFLELLAGNDAGAGVFALNNGSGIAAVNMTGGDIRVAGVDSDGLRAQSNGGTYAVVASDGTVESGSGLGAGIHTLAASGGTVDITSDAVINGARSGIAIRDGDLDFDGFDETGGTATVTTAGLVTGDAILGVGDDTFNLVGGVVTGTVFGDDRDEATSDDLLANHEGDDSFNWTAGALVGGFDGQDGSDNGIVSAAGFDGTQILDGGDDVSSADGFIDVLTLQGLTVSTAGSNLLDWEIINIDGGTVDVTGGTLIVGSDLGTGLNILADGTVDGGSMLAVTGNVTTFAGGTFEGTGTGAGVYSISGTLTNNGTVTTQDDVVGDVITVGGDYAGTGLFLVDVDTSNDTADSLVVTGDVVGGPTSVGVNNLTPDDATGNDITVITVGGVTAPGDFMLVGGALTAGAYDYGLELQGSEFVLAANLNATGSVYQSAPSVLGGFNRLPTLEQRVGQRQWVNESTNMAYLQPSTGGWVRLHGDRLDATTSADSSVASNRWGLQAGYDFKVDESDNGRWVFGATAQVGELSSAVMNLTGNGSIDALAFGVGATATWYGDNGTYVDMQGQINWIDGDFASDGAGSLAEGEFSKAYALSIEGGHRIATSETGTLVPQAQLTWGRVDGASFTDSMGDDVDLGTNDSLIGRLGLAYETEGKEENGDLHKIYAIGNILHDFSDDTVVSVVGADLAGGIEDTWLEIGLGGSFTTDDDSTVYGELSYRAAVNSAFGDNRGLALNAGFRKQW